ncbi:MULTISPECIES: hypothetical protein [unclassified Flavobacterium]|uniref:hypothetical protein n=1 Tax=unclassified Flavobacterium TaxID=196869 RepID=UPI001F13BDA7|nr:MULTISPECIES: hypothetical protein [unclassified Flavobacterium]UMY66678.1 hypothetical protein MKO97_04645 [Flavobacterium sp. HJ-32-4]
MKTILRNVLAIAVLSAAFTSCSSDSDNGPSSSFVVDPLNFKGTITDGEVELDPDVEYNLTGKLQVATGATLTIPAGTVIKASGGTSAYIAVEQGAKIYINGTAADPVIMTSANATPAPGNWGGLVICGKAPINRTSGGAGTAQAEVSDLTYGGTDAADSSGSIKYLVISYCGAAYTSEKEFNGVSFFGVGSGTVVENVEVYHGADDGFEFFGGTVNTRNLIAIGNEDDQFDWTEGWNGTNQNWYGKIAFGKGNRGIEADNYEFGFANTPISMPTITNLTLIGPGSTADAAAFPENDGLKLRRGTKGSISNLFLDGWKTGFNVEHDETIAAVGAGTLKATAVTFGTDIATKSKGKDTAGATVDVVAVFAEGASQGAGAGAGKPAWANDWSTGF